MGAKLLRLCQWRHKAGENKWEWKWREQNAYPTYQNSATITTPTLGSAPEQLTNQRIISGDIIITIILPIIITIIIIKAAVQKISDDRHLFTFLCKCDWPEFYILLIFFHLFFGLSCWLYDRPIAHYSICFAPFVCSGPNLSTTRPSVWRTHGIFMMIIMISTIMLTVIIIDNLFLFKCK